MSGRRCLGCGDNVCYDLGLGSDYRRNPTPIELPVPMDDIISCDGVTVIRSGDTLLACGDNECRRIASNCRRKFTPPTPINLPGHAVKVMIFWEIIFVQLTDGAWVGRGEFDSDHFTPVPEDYLINGRLPGWTPVNDRFAEKLNAGKAVNVMFIPEPITITKNLTMRYIGLPRGHRVLQPPGRPR